MSGTSNHATPWLCPYCPHQVRDQDDAIRKVAVNSHLKSHNRTLVDPSVGLLKGGGPKGKKGSWIEDVAEGIGEAVGGFIGKLLD